MTRKHLWLLPTVLTTAVLALSACGGGSDDNGGGGVASLADPGTAAPSASASGDLEKELDTYVECLRKQGMNLSDPTVDAKGQVSFGKPTDGQKIDRDKLQAAMKVCGDLPAGLTGGQLANDPAIQDTAVKFAECMRGQGIDVPDPDLSKLGSGGAFGDLDQDNPKVAAAIKACQKVWTDAGSTPRGGGN